MLSKTACPHRVTGEPGAGLTGSSPQRSRVSRLKHIARVPRSRFRCVIVFAIRQNGSWYGGSDRDPRSPAAPGRDLALADPSPRRLATIPWERPV
jgi:hypothetical protein